MGKKKNGKFVVLEGTDGSGKATQAQLLKKRFNKEGIIIETVDFPRYYSSIWGKLVGEFLAGKFGKFTDLDPHMVALPYMLDEYTWSRDIGRPLIDKGINILSDRYFTSNVHQIAKLKTTAKKKYRDWLWNAGYNELKILKPDLVVFLNVNPMLAKKLIKKKKPRAYLKGRKTDIAERIGGHQEDAYREYLYTVKHNSNWVGVNCISGGAIDSTSNVHDRVWEVVKREFGK